ncbi:MAG: hypothetical protein JWR38_4311 [Mucilaginibacter sp.]|nr:hypothetical protein [Mucilaginibacter sp.]
MKKTIIMLLTGLLISYVLQAQQVTKVIDVGVYKSYSAAPSETHYM